MALSQALKRLISAIDEDPNADVEEIQELILDTSESEVQSSGELFISLCHKLATALVKTKRSVSGIHLLSQAISKLQTQEFQLTPIHADFCLLCLDAKCLNPALPILDTIYTKLRTTDNKSEDSKNIVLFFYYGGLIYTAIKNFERASYFFEVVITMPAVTASSVMQETYKKQILVNLLLHGKLTENLLPRYTPACLARQRKQIGQAYHKLAHEFSTYNHEKIQRLISNNSSIYERDENMGLVKQCLTQVHRRNIQRLTKTFLTLSLRDVANNVGLASEKEAEAYILNMIDDGEIFATINQKDGMVVFEDSSESFDTVTVFRSLQSDISKASNLIKILDKLHPNKQPMKVFTREEMNVRDQSSQQQQQA